MKDLQSTLDDIADGLTSQAAINDQVKAALTTLYAEITALKKKVETLEAVEVQVNTNTKKH